MLSGYYAQNTTSVKTVKSQALEMIVHNQLKYSCTRHGLQYMNVNMCKL